jgi:hypothetical protein
MNIPEVIKSELAHAAREINTESKIQFCFMCPYLRKETFCPINTAKDALKYIKYLERKVDETQKELVTLKSEVLNRESV